ncbi:hypothetical protein DID88_000649 [Monilinia fructigena]|uniref:Uncharacterized protein n=1 Tax=Monilinia fructigena TaxID=38457 RepID=A0A395IKX4_9HELO|nr:hypothetical protein DID88_000649 [Monilinia fructigena]
MEQHLDNVESSFLPAVSPIGIRGKVGADDTYLFDANRNGEKSPTKETQTPKRNASSSGSQDHGSPPTPEGTQLLPSKTFRLHQQPLPLQELYLEQCQGQAWRRTLNSITISLSIAEQSDEGDMEATPKRSRQNLRAFAESENEVRACNTNHRIGA